MWVLFVIVEAILTVIAWKRGWRWRSMIPVMILIGAIAVRVAMSSSRFHSPLDALNITWFVHILYIISLIRLAVKSPKNKTD
jgi:hypothetical protein